MKVITSDAQVIELGITETSPTIGINDFSRRVTDDFGVTTVVKRAFARTMSLRFALPTSQIDDVSSTLASLRATSALWIADERFSWLSIEGFYKDFDASVEIGELSYCTLTVEGLADGAEVVDLGGDPAPAGRSSTLRLIQPIEITPAMLLSTNVPEIDYSTWSAGTTYALGARVISTATHRIYESAVAANLGNDPASSPLWLNIGPTNRWAMFDQALGTVTDRNESIAVMINAGPISAVALLDVTGDTVRVQANGYDRTMPVQDGAITFLDLPPSTEQVTVTIASPGMAAVGTLLVGSVAALGLTEESPSTGITDFSKKNVDEFGDITIVPRSWAKRMSTRALIRTDALDVVASRIAAVRATPALWIAKDDTDALTIYGFFKDFSIEVGEAVSILSLSVEGLSEAPALPAGLPATNWPDVGDPDPARPKPQDGATVGAVVGDNLLDGDGNPLTAEDVVTSEGTAARVAMIGDFTEEEFAQKVTEAESGIADLFTTYGDTASAAASRLAAEAAEEAAELAKSQAQTAATNADDSASAAAGEASSAATSASSAEISAVAAQASATTANTKAGEASVSASNSAASATTAAGHSSSASTSAGAAATSRDTASGSASAAAVSESNAATQATNAGNSAVAAASSALTANSKAGEASSAASIASSEAAIATAKAAAAQIALTLISSMGGSNYVPNGGFDDYPSGVAGQFPTGWGAWVGSESAQRVAGLDGSYSVRIISTAGNAAGIFIQQPAKRLNTNDYVVVEAEVTLNSGTLSGAGILLSAINAAATGEVEGHQVTFAAIPSSNGPASVGVAGRTYRFQKLLRFVTADVHGFNIYIQSHWSGHGSIAAANSITWHRVGVRAATQAEIAEGVGFPTLQAQVTVQGSVLADHNTRLASWLARTSSGAGFAEIKMNALDSNGLAASYISLIADAIKLGTMSSPVLSIVAGRATVSADLYIQNGRIVVESPTHMKVIGNGFGSANQFVEWYGPKMALSACTEANGTYWLKTNGDAYYGGTLSAGVLKHSVQSAATAATSNVTTGSFGSNGGARTVVLSYSCVSTATLEGACPVTPVINAVVELYRGTSASGTLMTTLNITNGSWSCAPGLGPFEPGGWTATMNGTLTFTDNSGGTSSSYFARITSRNIPAGNLTQNLGIISTEG